MSADIHHMGTYDPKHLMVQFMNGYSKEEQFQMMPSSFNPFFTSHMTPMNKGIRENSEPPQKKKGTPVPPELKTKEYYERRKRNNDSARRSRESRRQKEDFTKEQMNQLQMENSSLRAELHQMKAVLDQYKLYFASMQTSGNFAVHPNFTPIIQ